MWGLDNMSGTGDLEPHVNRPLVPRTLIYKGPESLIVSHSLTANMIQFFSKGNFLEVKLCLHYDILHSTFGHLR